MHGRVRFKVGDLVREKIDKDYSEVGIIIKLAEAGWVVRFSSHGDFWMSPQNLELVNAAR